MIHLISVSGGIPMEQMQKAFDYVDRHFDEMLTDLKEICACPGTASNP